MMSLYKMHVSSLWETQIQEGKAGRQWGKELLRNLVLFEQQRAVGGSASS